MENSLKQKNESLSAACNGKTANDDSEESSWTFYMQDFISGSDDHQDNKSSFSSGYGTSSLLSDAASSADRKLARIPVASDRSNSNKPSFRRPRKAKAAGVIDDLEDTASSPVNSPKGSYMNQLILKQNERNNQKASDINNQQGHIDSGHNHKGLEKVEGDSDCSELKKKGLCLVPVSMLANYFG